MISFTLGLASLAPVFFNRQNVRGWANRWQICFSRFWALPVLAIAGISLRRVIGFPVMSFFVGVVVSGLTLFVSGLGRNNQKVISNQFRDWLSTNCILATSRIEQ
jgi:hypothetical protein